MAKRKVKEKKKTISEGDMRRLEERSYEVRLAKKDKDIQLRDVQIQKLRMELFQNRIKEMERVTVEKDTAIKAAESRYLDFTKALKKEKELSDKWGYDPLTGEIKE